MERGGGKESAAALLLLRAFPFFARHARHTPHTPTDETHSARGVGGPVGEWPRACVGRTGERGEEGASRSRKPRPSLLALSLSPRSLSPPSHTRAFFPPPPEQNLTPPCRTQPPWCVIRQRRPLSSCCPECDGDEGRQRAWRRAPRTLPAAAAFFPLRSAPSRLPSPSPLHPQAPKGKKVAAVPAAAKKVSGGCVCVCVRAGGVASCRGWSGEQRGLPPPPRAVDLLTSLFFPHRRPPARPRRPTPCTRSGPRRSVSFI